MFIIDLNSFKLVRGFGADLEQLRKLTKPWVDKVGLGLESAGFVKSFLVQDATQGNLAALSGNINFHPDLLIRPI